MTTMKTAESQAVHAAAQRILDLTSRRTDLVKSAEFFQVLHDLYEAGKAAAPSNA